MLSAVRHSLRVQILPSVCSSSGRLLGTDDFAVALGLGPEIDPFHALDLS